MLKKNSTLLLIIVLFITASLIQYFSIIAYLDEMFQYTTGEIRNLAIDREIKQFKLNLIETFILLFLKSLGMFICLNIGFLYFDIKLKMKEIMKLILFSCFALVFHQFLIVILIKLSNWTFTNGSMDSISEKLTLSNYINIEKTTPWIKSSLASINLEQFLTLILLGIGIHKIAKINYKRAFSITARTYGLGVLLWFSFAVVMEMNFSYQIMPR